MYFSPNPLISSIIFLGLLISCQNKSIESDPSWSVYKSDKKSSSYSSLLQINRHNVEKLEVAWKFIHSDVPPGESFGKYECNPIIVEDVLYATSSRSWVYALDATDGSMIWSYDPFDGARGGGMKRGVTFWSYGKDERVLFTAGNFLYALDSKTGVPIDTFGDSGKVDLNQNLGVNPDSIWVIPTSPGIIYRDLIILGSEVSESYDAAPGHIRAYDVRTGELVWIFHTIPQPGERGYETWPSDAWKYTGGVNNWGGMSLDEERGIVYAPLGSPTYDFYGANRKGQNLYGNSLVALDASNGKLLWHFQTTHHDVWDYDLPAPPTLIDLKKDGEALPLVTLVGKTGFLFVFDRISGQSTFPIEERQVPLSNVPGEELWPTQPFPLKPEPFTRQQFSETDLPDVNDTIRHAVRERFNELRFEGLYTPPDPSGTLMVPGTRGGAEWGGTAVDPETGVLYVNSNESPEIMTMQSQAETNTVASSNLSRGERYYLTHCAICHGGDRRGQLPLHPALVDLPAKRSKAETSELVRAGIGRMPGFAHLSDSQREAITDYLFGEEERSEELAANPSKTSEGYRNITAYSFFRDPEGYPAINPPWGTLNAIDLHTGEYLWKIPLGNYPERQRPGGPETGAENWGGPIVTAGGLVFIAATRDNMFRAFHSGTGELLWSYQLPGGGYATPATFLVEGKQYVVIAVSSSESAPGGSIIAFSLPQQN